ncbi:MAG TPA: ATP-dependent DNA helicase RecG [Candidatus Paceibacterota bacterium]|nr:ATP-dependent DNA helicase RecG [Candidatus Paceibacterota bacterium]
MHSSTPLDSVFRLSAEQKRALRALRLATLRDLLYHFPVKYNRLAEATSVQALREGEEATIYGSIRSIDLRRSFRSKVALAEAQIDDGSAKVKAIWFHQPYLAKMFPEGTLVRVSGKVSAKNGTPALLNPAIERIPELPLKAKDSLFGEKTEEIFAYPTYPESKGITSRWFFHAIDKTLKSGILDSLIDPIPQEILSRYHLPSLPTALVWIHAPRKESDSLAARKRFAFEEVFCIQLGKQQERHAYASKQGFPIAPAQKDIDAFLARFPFKATGAQERAIDTILADFKSGRPMSRLLEGDVGSGKTAVAAATAYAAVATRPEGQDFGTLQVAYMAPTEILATQHFESFIEFFRHMPISIALITGSGCRKFPSKSKPGSWTDISRSQLLKWVANGEISVLIGTHALIQKTVRFKNLAYIIIDEQHRFGTAQRQKLARKEDVLPHLLSMTATPIPRTLALTIYGDLDLSLLDELPKGRKPVITEIVPPNKREAIYEKVRAELTAGRQAYVICPRIDEPDPEKETAVEAKSVKAEAERLNRDVFPEWNIGVLHGKTKPAEKDEIMQALKDKEIDILVATSVVEVGVNVPNATVIIIEGSERFGLAQLHQLRGRVMRSSHQAYCYLFAEGTSEKTKERLKALASAGSGFELAELDLKLRGAGELYGRKQWGVSDIGMEAIKNLKMVEAARTEAARLVAEDPDLARYPLLRERSEAYREALHFE